MYTDCGAVDDNGDGNLRKRPYYRSHNTPFLRTLYNFLVNFLEASGLAIGSICDTISSHFDSFFGDSPSSPAIETKYKQTTQRKQPQYTRKI